MCGYIGETYGWHYGFGLATIGMLTGLAVFVAPTLVTQIFIMSGAVSAAVGLCVLHPDDPAATAVNVLVGLSLLTAGVISLVALSRGGLPEQAGAPPDLERLRRRVAGPVSAEWVVYLGTLVAIPVFALLVSGLAPLTADNRGLTLIPDSVTSQMAGSSSLLVRSLAVVVTEVSRPAGLILILSGLVALAYVGRETVHLDIIRRHRMYVVLILTFFSMLFWAFFEQAGSSVNNFTDRNVDRVTEDRRVSAAEVGQTIRFRVPLTTDDDQLKQLPLLTQEQLGYRYDNETMSRKIAMAIRSEEQQKNKLDEAAIEKLIADATGDQTLSMTGLSNLRGAAAQAGAPAELRTVSWTISASNVGMGVATTEIPASVFQAANPIFILVFGLILSGLWVFLATRGWEPSTPVKFALGLVQLGLGFGVFWYGAQNATDRGMVSAAWLVLGYLLHTTGELCLSPVGLSMVTRLSPAYLVSTVMGMWFLATAFSQYLAAIIAQFTGVGHGDAGAGQHIPVPRFTLHLYGDVFGKIALAAVASGAFCLLLSPLLSRWMHTDVQDST